MTQSLPISLQLLLEAPLEEELYLDWSHLLETTLLDYVPPPRHLALCMSILVDRTTVQEPVLCKSCHRILRRTLSVHGPTAFRHVIEFEQGVGRHGRVSNRRATTMEGEAEEEDQGMLTIPLATTGSVFARFRHFWDLLAYSQTRADEEYFRYFQLVSFIVEVALADFDGMHEKNLDLTRSLMVALLRTKTEKSTDIRQVVNAIWSMADVSTTDQEASSPEESSSRIAISNTNLWNSDEAIELRQELIVLFYKITQIPRVNVILENEFYMTLASALAPLPLYAFVRHLECQKVDKPAMSLINMSICHEILFRLAAFPGGRTKLVRKEIDWERVKGWCGSEARSADAHEIAKVHFLKFTLLRVFCDLQSTAMLQEEIDEILVELRDSVSDAIAQEEAEPETLEMPETEMSPMVVLVHCKRMITLWQMALDETETRP